jgi:hypothetical protein
MPPVADRAPETSQHLAEDHRQAVVDADLITISEQTKTVADAFLPCGSMQAVSRQSDRIVYLHSRYDPLIDTENAAEGYRLAFGILDKVEDPYRPPTSHAPGATYPQGVAAVLRGEI